MYDDRHDNTLVSRREGHPVVAAVVDWNVSTLGDPLADLATWLTYWTGRDEAGQPLVVGAGVPTLPGFPTADEVAMRYAAVTGRDVTGLGVLPLLHRLPAGRDRGGGPCEVPGGDRLG